MSSTGQRPLVCEFGSCGRTYSTLHARRQHYRRQHSGDWQTKKVERRLSRSGRVKSACPSLGDKSTGRCTSFTRAGSAQPEDTPPCDLIASPEFNTLVFKAADAPVETPADNDASQETLPQAPASARSTSSGEPNERFNELGLRRSASEYLPTSRSAHMYSRHSSVETLSSCVDSQQYLFQPSTPLNSDSASITADAASLSAIDELLLLLHEENLLPPPPPAPPAAVQTLCTHGSNNDNYNNSDINSIYNMPVGMDMSGPVAAPNGTPLLQLLSAGATFPVNPATVASPPWPSLMFAPTPSPQPPWLLYDNISADVHHMLSGILLT